MTTPQDQIAALEKERDEWREKFNRLASDALIALSAHTATPIETYREVPGQLRNDITRAIERRDEQIERLKADCAVMREAVRELEGLGDGPNDREDYYCPLCIGHHPDSSKIEHARHCPVGKALSTNPGAELLEELAELRKDKERLDWIEKQTNGDAWIARQSSKGRGFRLHNTHPQRDLLLCETAVFDSAREALDAAIQENQR